jgi:hypothetical protein
MADTPVAPEETPDTPVAPEETPAAAEAVVINVGDPIEARCTKCRANNPHVIITMVEDAPLKVQCDICSREHKFRLPSVKKKPAARRVVDPKVAERKEWETLRPDMNEKDAKDYSMTGAFKVDSLIKHATFGLGLVQRVAGTQKIEVLFEDGKKLMRCK